MRVFPAVDILGGKCVQLVQGKRESATAYGDPLACAHRWIEAGADALHVINLDGAFGDAAKNADLINALVKETGIEIELGGGIRSIEDAQLWLGTGVSRIILSTLAIQNPHCISQIAKEFGSDRVMAGVDARGGNVAIHGWQETAGNYLYWAETFEKLGAGSLLYTNVDVEGLQKGIAIKPVQGTLYPMSMCRSSLPVGSPEELISHSSGTRVHTALCSDQHFTAERLTFQRQ